MKPQWRVLDVTNNIQLVYVQMLRSRSHGQSFATMRPASRSHFWCGKWDRVAGLTVNPLQLWDRIAGLTFDVNRVAGLMVNPLQLWDQIAGLTFDQHFLIRQLCNHIIIYNLSRNQGIILKFGSPTYKTSHIQQQDHYIYMFKATSLKY